MTRPLIVVIAPDSRLTTGLAQHFENRVDVLDAADTAEGEKLMRNRQVDVLLCRDDLPGETGLMFFSRHAGDTPWMQRILLSAPLEPELLLHVINEARVFRCVIEPCPPEELHKHIVRAISEAKSSRARFLAAARADHPAKLFTHWLGFMPRITLLLAITCGGVFAAGLATLLALYLIKSLLGIDLIDGAHLSSLWN